MNTIIKELEQEMARVLAYWTKNSWDPGQKIFLTLGCDNRPLPDGRRSAVLISRVLWAFSSGYNLTGDEQYLVMAQNAYQDLSDHYLDREFGGVFELLNADASPRDPSKKVYTQSYAIYALSEFYKASGDMEALAAALAVFEKIESEAFDAEQGVYVTACTREWQQESGNLPIDTYLHLTESYTNLHKVWPDDYLKSRLQGIVITLLTHFLRPDGSLYQILQQNALEKEILERKWPEQNMSQWSFVPGEDLSDRFADDAEGAWFILEAASRFADPAMEQAVSEASVKMMMHVAREGADTYHGGIYDRKNTDGSMSTDKMWWEESESVIGLMYAYRESKDPLLLKTGLDTYAFLKKYIMNPAEEWNWKTQADGTPVPVTDPYDPLKCPYHSVRLATACIPLLEELTQEKT